MASALDALQALDAHPSVQNMTASFNRYKRMSRPYVPYILRLLLVSTFVEDAGRTLFEFSVQQDFYWDQLYIPRPISFLLILISTLTTFAAAVLLFLKPTQRLATKLLLGLVIYQQLIYGRHSPITSGNFGFLIRNLCLIGTLLLLLLKASTPGSQTLPGIPDPPRKDEARRDGIALATRVLLGLLCLEMFDVISWYWGFIMLPLSAAIVVGYKTDVMALFLVVFYVVATLFSKQFWFIDASKHAYAAFYRDVIRFEFLQTLSIMSGFVVLIMSGPGALSLDEQLKRRKAW